MQSHTRPRIGQRTRLPPIWISLSPTPEGPPNQTACLHLYFHQTPKSRKSTKQPNRFARLTAVISPSQLLLSYHHSFSHPAQLSSRRCVLLGDWANDPDAHKPVRF